MYKHVLVTGGAGFIGSHMADTLIAQKRHVKVLVRKRPYNNIERDYLNNLKKNGAELVYGDLRQLPTLHKATSGVECIFHLGAVSRPMRILSKEYYDNSALGTKNILMAAKGAKIKKFIHVSTVSVLGVSPDGHPLGEDDYQPTDLTYATSKLVGEKLALEYCNAYKIPVVVIRPCLTYGPRCSVRLVMFKFIKKRLFPLFNEGSAKMEFLYIDNVIQALLLAESNHNIHGEIFNITNGRSYSLKEVTRTIAAELGVPSPSLSIPTELGVFLGYVSEFISAIAGVYPPFSRSAADWMSCDRNVYDCTKAKKYLGYKPTVSLREGIRRSIAWYRQYNLL